jgi:hypothetical protein
MIPGYPLELEQIVCRALQRNPADRFATCAELASALEKFCASGEWASDSHALAGWITQTFPQGSEEWLSKPSAEANLTISLLSQAPPMDAEPPRSWYGPVGLLLGGAVGLGLLAQLLPASERAPEVHSEPEETVIWELPASPPESELPVQEPVEAAAEPVRAVPMGTLLVEGDGQVALIGPDGQRALPGKVRAGTWTWTSQFGSTAGPAGTLELAPGSTMIVKCSSFARHCRVFRP